MEQSVLTKDVPDHVPAELVRPFPFIFGSTTRANPFEDFAPAVHNGPELIYAPLSYPGGGSAWVPRCMQDMRAIYLDTEHFSSKDFSPFAPITGGSWSNSPAELDPPLHGPFRHMANPLFTPKAMAALDDRIRACAAEYIEGFRSKGGCDFKRDFALKFPIKVFMELMGLPLDRVDQFLEWETMLIHSTSIEVIAQGTHQVVGYLTELLEDRRRNPANDLLTWTTTATKEGKPLTQDEQIGFSFNLFVGGLDTVTANITNQTLHLARNPQHRKLLRENPALIPNAIDEFMRAYGAVTTFRTCAKETTVRGVTMKPGDKIVMSTTLAGRDPAEFPNPGEVRLDRKPRHTGFGFGIHTCIGMHLARREMRIAMEELLARIPDFSIAPGHEMEFHLGVIQPVALPLVWDPAANS